MRIGAPAVAGLLLLGGGALNAGVPTLSDCLEGGDFIANAARSRDNGVTRLAFLERMREDFELIHAFPRELRWFAQDTDDECFLLAAAARVFDTPNLPERHREQFLRSCFDRAAGAAHGGD